MTWPDNDEKVELLRQEMVTARNKYRSTRGNVDVEKEAEYLSRHFQAKAREIFSEQIEIIAIGLRSSTKKFK